MVCVNRLHTMEPCQIASQSKVIYSLLIRKQAHFFCAFIRCSRRLINPPDLHPSSLRIMPPLQGHTPGPSTGSTQAQSPPSKLQPGTLHAASHTPLAREEREQPGEQEVMVASAKKGRV